MRTNNSFFKYNLIESFSFGFSFLFPSIWSFILLHLSYQSLSLYIYNVIILTEEIVAMDEYYLPAAENNVIEQSIQEIAIPNPNSIEEKIERQVILELGAGAGHRTLPLIEAMAKNATFTNIVPCDISPEALLQNREYYEKSPSYNSDTSVIQYTPLGGTHQEALAQASTLFSSSSSIFNYMFMGSSLGNYDDDEIVDIITDVARFVLKKATFHKM